MYQERRPTCITVIGWAWIIIGSLMCFSAAMALFSSVMIDHMSHMSPEAQRNMPVVFRYFTLLAVIQLGVAITGLFSGINFLKLKAWSRSILEILTWILLLSILGFVFYLEYRWLFMSSGHGPRGFDIIGAVMSVAFIGFYGVPLGIMIKYLRGDKVKNAIIGNAEHPSGTDGG